jgi:hypothetical protein
MFHFGFSSYLQFARALFRPPDNTKLTVFRFRGALRARKRQSAIPSIRTGAFAPESG